MGADVGGGYVESDQCCRPESIRARPFGNSMRHGSNGDSTIDGLQCNAGVVVVMRTRPGGLGREWGDEDGPTASHPQVARRVERVDDEVEDEECRSKQMARGQRTIISCGSSTLGVVPVR